MHISYMLLLFTSVQENLFPWMQEEIVFLTVLNFHPADNELKNLSL